MILATFHGVALTVHSPRDFIQDLAELAARTTARRQNNGLIMNFYDDDDEDLDLLEWTASPLFVIASSHAITVSKLVRSLLAPDGIRGRYVTGMASPKIVKSLSVLWPVIVLRAAWIHVLCIRKFQKIARQIQAGEEADPLFASLGMPAVSPDFLASLLDDIDACLKCIDEMAGGVPVDRAPAFDGIVKPAEKQQPPLKLGRDPWRYARLVHGVMRKLLRIDDGTGQRQSLSLTEEEIEELSLVKSSSV